jgi:cytochrome b subunit of formate dehydrogenase
VEVELRRVVLALVNLVVAAIIIGVSWTIVYYLAWKPLVAMSPRIPEILTTLDITSTLWWRDFLALFFDILIILVAAYGTLWVIAHLVVELRRVGEWFKYERSPEGRQDKWVLRLTISQRIQHITMIVTFVICMITGFAMYYANDPYWRLYIYTSRDTFVTLHIISGLIMGVLVIAHFTYYATLFLGVAWRGGFRVAFESFPILKFYTLSNFKSLVQVIGWGFSGRVLRPRYHKYDSEQLFEYWGVYWGIAILGIPGLFMILWGPGALDGVLWVMHYKEAILAVTFILLVHITHTHFRPTHFPINLVFIHGRMPLKRIKEDHPEWYEELVRGGRV